MDAAPDRTHDTPHISDEGMPDDYSIHSHEAIRDVTGEYPRNPTLQEAEESLAALLKEPKGVLATSYEQGEEISRRIAERSQGKYPYTPRPLKEMSEPRQREFLGMMVSDRLAALKGANSPRHLEKPFTQRELLAYPMMEPQVRILEVNLIMEHIRGLSGEALVRDVPYQLGRLYDKLREAEDGVNLLSQIAARRAGIANHNFIVLDPTQDGVYEELRDLLTTLADQCVELHGQISSFEREAISMAEREAVQRLSSGEPQRDKFFMGRATQLVQYADARGIALNELPLLTATNPIA